MINYQEKVLEILETVKSRQDSYLDKFIKELKKSKYICVFGAGQIGCSIVCLFRELKLDVKIDFFCDNDKAKWGKTFCNDIKCISPDILKNYKDDVAIIVATQYHKQIVHQLKKEDLNNFYPIVTFFYLKNNIFCKNSIEQIEYTKKKLSEVIEILSDKESERILFTLVRNWVVESPLDIDYEDICTENQYFVDNIIKLKTDEVFIDAGAYDGGTMMEFLEKVNKNFSAVHSFELDKKNFAILEQAIKGLNKEAKNKVSIYNLGLWNKKQTIRYNTLTQGSNIDNQGDTLGNVDSLDNILQGKEVTFIKMDIEGAELNALKGATNIIKTQKPKLAICVYHDPKDLWEIPLYIKSLVPEYKIYFRHHTTIECETVCYAVI